LVGKALVRLCEEGGFDRGVLYNDFTF